MTLGAPTQESEVVPDCRACGACCHGDEMWVHVMAVDDQRLGEPAVRSLTVLTRHGRGYFARSMKMVDGRCVAYRDRLDDGGCGCSIYDVRPDICRDFRAGSPDCHAARRRRGLE
jgi:uncharacterized protein